MNRHRQMPKLLDVDPLIWLSMVGYAAVLQEERLTFSDVNTALAPISC
jgi:hypothetical protein